MISHPKLYLQDRYREQEHKYYLRAVSFDLLDMGLVPEYSYFHPNFHHFEHKHIQEIV